MNRRDFFKVAAAGALAVAPGTPALAALDPLPHPPPRPRFDQQNLQTYLEKVRQFDQDHPGDVFLTERHFDLLESALNRFRRLQRTVGYGRFHLLSFDDAIQTAKRYPDVGDFTMAELNFLEMIFYAVASDYGFYGQKPLKNLTDRIPAREVVWVPHAGNYLYRGRPEQTYARIRRDLGEDVVLTSGVRSIIKQFLLFLNKAYDSRGNLSRASRSLAPPGYSYHGISDFDVGQVGFGVANFTQEFVTTPVFKRLEAMGYASLRYARDNMLGVRFEPWHIKVVDRY